MNVAPVITSDGGGATASVDVAENTTTVTTVTATDADGDPLTFSLSGGTDQAFFSIDGNSGLLTFDAAQDFETPADGNGDNVYEVEVTVSDGNGGTDIQLISVTVTDANDPPTAADNTVTTDEDTAYTFTAADFNFSDVDTGDTLQWVTIESLPAAGSLELSSVAVTVGQQISFADIDVGNLKFIPDPDDNGTGYANFDFTVSDGTAAAFADSVAGGTGSGSLAPLTLSGISGGSNELYVVVVSMRADQTITSIDGGGLTWTKQIEQRGGRGETDFAMYTAYGSPSDFDLAITTDSDAPVAAIAGRYSGTDGVIYDVAVGNTNGEATGPGIDLLPVSGGTDTNNPVLNIDPGAANRTIINGVTGQMNWVITEDSDYAPSDTKNAIGTNGIPGDEVRVELLDRVGAPAGVDNISHTIGAARDWVTGAIAVGNVSSATHTMTIDVTAVNDAPTVAGAGGTLAYTEGDGAQVIDAALTITDVDDQPTSPRPRSRSAPAS